MTDERLIAKTVPTETVTPVESVRLPDSELAVAVNVEITTQ
ncbi:MAG: hypothetical protein P8P91_17820 [Pseudomonadales bacterium]|nr:hypothetical protein [Pseudomonadales bacterium]